MDYEKKYKEALEKAKKLYGKYCINNVLEDLFPELKEIEDKDEMIRQCLIEHIKCNKDLNWSLFQWFKPDTIIAWLEEQGKNKKLDADKVIEWLKTHGNLVPVVTIRINEVIAKFKEDFGL